MKKNNLLTLFLMLIGTSIFAQRNFFRAVQPGELPQAREAVKQVRNKGLFRLDEPAMRNYLRNAPMEFRNNGITLPLAIPLPDGRTEVFNMVESPILSPAVAAAHPEIKTYTGSGTTNKKAVIRLSLTSSGFSAIILNIDGSNSVYFEPYSRLQPGIYFNYFTKDAIVPQGRRLPGGSGGEDVIKPSGVNRRTATIGNVGNRLNTAPTGSTLTVFRIAVAADGEFVQLHGGTVASAFDDVVAYVNRANAFFRNELSVGFTMVSGTNLIFPDATTDPYTNSDQDMMLIENQTTCDAIIGNANYDVGHVMGSYPGTSGGGLAALGVVCNDPLKAKGASNEGDLIYYVQSFYDKLFFHELGHQFGMTHSYNSSIPVCTSRVPETSVEPGSGATVMSYSFICGNGPNGENDDYVTNPTYPITGNLLQFHTVSYQQAVTYLTTIMPYPSGVVVTNTGNTPPVVTMPPNYTIPKSTPFYLTGSATDVNGDMLTYCWEGTNTGGDAANPPDANTLTDPSKPPFSRTYAPATTPTRIFPVLDSILNGANYARADKLPSISIGANYNLTVRDNNPAGGGVTYGSVTVTINGNIGPFLETTNLSASYVGGSSQTITWSVNGTDAATPNVKISLSTDGGFTFPTVLAASTPNDGTQAVTLPNVATTTARIKVESVGNIFFDISNVDFTITTAPEVTYNITASAGTNGSISPGGAVSVASGASQTFTITPNTCYQISDVTVDDVSQGAISTYTFTNVTATHTISATFSQLTYAITASAGINGSITPGGSTTVSCGANQTFTIAANSCYQISDVTVDGVSQGSIATYTFTNVTTSHTISATFSQLSYTITSSAGANGTITPNGATVVNCGASQTYTIAPNGGFNVQNVVVDGVSQGAITTYTFTNVTAAHTINATFVSGSFTITASAGTGGSVSPGGAVSVASGTNQTFTITPNACYRIAGVSVDGVSQGAVSTYTFTNVTAAHTISATFTPLTYTITASAGANGSISPNGPVSVNCGANRTFNISANACYKIANVVVDGVSQGSIATYTFTNVTASHTISATFSQLTYTITSSAGANGTITPNGTTIVNCGANQTYSITPGGGFNVQNVSVDGVSQGAITTYTFSSVTAAHTINATFVAAPGGVCGNGTNLTTSNLTTGSATFNWTASVNPVQWEVRYKKISTGSQWTSTLLAGSARSFILSGLLSGQRYMWQIRAKCGTSWTEFSESVHFETLSGRIASSSRMANPEIEENMNGGLTVFPNPSTGRFTLSVNGPLKGNVQMNVYDMAGKLLFSKADAAVKGMNMYKLDLTKLIAGVYILKLKSGNESRQVKFIIAK